MINKKILAVSAIFALLLGIEVVIGIYVYVNVTDTQNNILNPPEKPETLSFTLIYPSVSVLFPILPINTTNYVHLNIELNYVGVIAERQPVNLTVSGFMTQGMANITDVVFVEFRGAVPYDNRSSNYGPWFSGVILQKDYVDQEGRVVLRNETITIIWNVQGYYNPVVVIRDKYDGNESLQDYTDFPVYVIGYSDFLQAKSNKIDTALSSGAFLLALMLSIDILWRLIDVTRGSVTSLKSEKCKNNLNMAKTENPKEIDNADLIEDFIHKIDNEKDLFTLRDGFHGYGMTLYIVAVFLFLAFAVSLLPDSIAPLIGRVTLVMAIAAVLLAFVSYTSKGMENNVVEANFRKAIKKFNIGEKEEEKRLLLLALLKIKAITPQRKLEIVKKMHKEMFTKEKLLERLYK